MGLIRENSKMKAKVQTVDGQSETVCPHGILHAVSRYGGSDGCVERASDYPRKVLEPSAGIGAFVDSVLDNNPKADIMAFEKRPAYGRYSRHLHPGRKCA